MKGKNNYVKNYDKNEKPSYLKYRDADNLYGWGMSLKLPVHGFDWIKETCSFIKRLHKKNYEEDSDVGYFLEIDVQYPEKIHHLHKDL